MENDSEKFYDLFEKMLNITPTFTEKTIKLVQEELLKVAKVAKEYFSENGG